MVVVVGIITIALISFGGLYYLIRMQEGGLNSCPELLDYTTNKSSGEAALARINTFRSSEDYEPLIFDGRAYDLAVARARDMVVYNYANGTNPITGARLSDFRVTHGLVDEGLVEVAAGGPTVVNGCVEWRDGDPREVINNLWSREFPVNLTRGAVGCYQDRCVFVGIR